jgi:hypothetical protein
VEHSCFPTFSSDICRVRHERDGQELTQVLANIDARIDELKAAPVTRGRGA